MKQTIISKIDELQHDFYDISKFIGENPELGHEEFKACKVLSEKLMAHGFSVTLGTCGLPTAFTAVYDSGKPGPAIGLMAEYDALPELGHACGHNLIGTMAVAAGIGLKDVLDQCGGTIYVYGTPAEETRGGKVTMAENGVFNHLDVAMMVHPYYRYQKSGAALAMDAIQFEYFGKASHAAAAPYKGINALDAVIQLFNSINALRQQVKSDVRIHGIISEGGQAANIIPDYAVAQFYVRAAHRSYLNEVVEKVKACAEGAALATGTRLELSNYEFSYDNMITNEELSTVFTNNLVSLGVHVEEIYGNSGDNGSMDMGNVSHIVPAIHPYVQICSEPYACHTREFQQAAMSEQGREAMMIGAKSMALTAYDILTNPELLQRIKREFQAKQQQH
jgi:amidohydrolase